MKLQKSAWLVALLSLGLSVGFVGCGDDDDDKKDDKNNQQQGENNQQQGDNNQQQGDNNQQQGDNNQQQGDNKDNTCGDGIINGDEVCDIGVDKTAGNEDDVMKDEAKIETSSCQLYAENSSADKDAVWISGTPRCAANCKGYKKGTCKSQESQAVDDAKGVNGIGACGSNLAITDKTAKATVTAKLGTGVSDNGIKAAIVCTGSTAKIDADVTSATFEATSAEISKDLSSFSAGDYVCFVAVKNGSDGAVVCPLAEGTPVKASGDASALVASTVDYKVAAASGTVAEWSDFSVKIGSDAINAIIVSEAGMLPTAGSDAAASLKLNVVGGQDVNVKVGQSADGSSIKAVNIGNVSSSKLAFGTAKNLDASAASHLVISSANMAGGSIKIVAKTGKFGGKFSVVAGSDEIIKEFASETYKTETGTIPAGVDKLYIYPWFESCSESSCGNLTIDSITITK